jgi:hypothetical protein
MQVFRDLLILGGAEQLAATVAEVERSLAGAWTRDRAEEEQMQSLATRSQPTYCFSCATEGGRPAATVFLTEKAPGVLYASNIVPQSKHQLSHGEYNGILEEFCDRFVRPAAGRVGARVDLTATEVALEHWLPPAAAEKLRTFSAAANKSTGSAHPLDRERWNDFVIAAHEGRSRLDSSTLRRWLIEIEGWASEVADQLAIEYEFGRELLAFAESRRSA